MGLCKCPKKRVTNQFCFDHRVNVCEHCMVTNHPKCIVQSYLQWLQDSDYNPACELCSRELELEDCVRLVCYHVYHWACLDQYARQLPATTAPAGYCCPSCKKCLFPASNLVSPVGDALREVLAGVNWARAGLDLPLLSEDKEQKPAGERRVLINETPVVVNHINGEAQSVSAQGRASTPKRPTATVSSNVHSVVHMDSTTDSPTPFSRSDSSSQPGRKVFQAVDEIRSVPFDHDEDKYKRRSAIEWLLRWWKSTTRPTSNRRIVGGIYRRYVMLAVLFFIGFLTVIVIFSWLGRMATENDPNLDINQNPMLHVKRS
ncbi:zinc finger protein-like 1 [Neocloeon triangulifer]|uniref:zinc finger protein-like 1 n=1 Tax=Neocloeon triangulifer TaxID=2078957 RepID=UPI00286EE846|nr:zinc finger protein-like 1 [Neocloeon triangulifer]